MSTKFLSGKNVTLILCVLIGLVGIVTVHFWINRSNNQEINIVSVITNPTSPESVTKTYRKPLHPYPAYGADQTKIINDLHIISILFRPKNIYTTVKKEWLENLEIIDAGIKTFYEGQFDKNLDISYQIVEIPTIGDKDIEEYDVVTLTNEVQEKNKSLIQSGKHNIWMIYLVRDIEYKQNIQGGNLGGLPHLQTATQYEFWLNNDAVREDTFGLIGSAHEFGHAIGIPHPWELPANINRVQDYGNVPGDLMAYMNNNLTLDDVYIRDDVKKEMGL